MSGLRHWWLWMLLLLGGLHAETSLPASPSPDYIRDDAKWLSPGAFQSLNKKLEAYERDTSSQFVVAIFPRIPEGAEIFDFSQRLFNFWKVSGTGQKNGAMLIIFSAERKMRIHVGRGMEGVLPDARCRQIIDDIIAPQLRAGNREGATNAGVDAMIAASKGEYKGTGNTHLDGSGSGSGGGGWIVLIFVAFIVCGIFFPRLFTVADVVFSVLGASCGGWSGGGSSGGGWSSGGGGGGGFSGGGDGNDSGGGGASGGW